MAWLAVGGVVLCLAPCAGAIIVAGMLAFHELRGRTSRLALRQTGRRASTDVFDEYLEAGIQEAAAPHLNPRDHYPLGRRARAGLLLNYLEERRPTVVATARALTPIEHPRVARPTRLLPLSA